MASFWQASLRSKKAHVGIDAVVKPFSVDKRKTDRYEIPHGSWFEWVSCAHYLAEIVWPCSWLQSSIMMKLQFCSFPCFLPFDCPVLTLWFHQTLLWYRLYRQLLKPDNEVLHLNDLVSSLLFWHTWITSLSVDIRYRTAIYTFCPCSSENLCSSCISRGQVHGPEGLSVVGVQVLYAGFVIASGGTNLNIWLSFTWVVCYSPSPALLIPSLLRQSVPKSEAVSAIQKWKPQCQQFWWFIHPSRFPSDAESVHSGSSRTFVMEFLQIFEFFLSLQRWCVKVH